MIDKTEYYKAFATWDGYKHLGEHLIEFFEIEDSDLVKITDNKKISEKFIEKYVGEENEKNIETCNKQSNCESSLQY